MNFCAIMGWRATLTELWAAMLAILGAVMRREEAIATVLWLRRDEDGICDEGDGVE